MRQDDKSPRDDESLLPLVVRTRILYLIVGHLFDSILKKNELGY